MRKLLLLVLVLPLASCGMVAKYRPNTVKGHHLDEIDKHTMAISFVDPIIYRRNKQVLPMRMQQVEEALSWNERTKARMQAMREN